MACEYTIDPEQISFYVSTNAADAVQGPRASGALLSSTFSTPTGLSGDSFDTAIFTPSLLAQASSYPGSTNPIIALDYSEGLDPYDPYGFAVNVHFRISFYTEPYMENLAYSAFSLWDQKRWYLPGRPPTKLTVNGLYVAGNTGEQVYYVPEILPHQMIRKQIGYDPYNITEEFPLLPGVAYYVKVEAFVNEAFEFLYNFVYKTRATKIRREFRGDNVDAGNWICSGQGKTDLKISKNQNHSIDPVVKVSEFDNIFYIAWKDYRKRAETTVDTNGEAISSPPDIVNEDYLNYPLISYGYWLANDHVFFTSGQRGYDRQVKNNSGGHIVATSASFALMTSLNFNPLIIFTNSIDDDTNLILYENNLFGIIPETDSDVNLLRDEDFIILSTDPKIRVFEEDVARKVYYTDDSMLTVVDKSVIELEISEVPGAYAIRLKNESDIDWSQWINIGPALAEGVDNTSDYNEDSIFNAQFLDNDRFVVPWILSAGNGLKNICCQVLTYNGISQTVCIQIIANITDFEYRISLSNTDISSIINIDPYLIDYQGKYIVKEGVVYIKVVFEEPEKLEKHFDLLSKYTKFNNRFTTSPKTQLTFNVIQKGSTVFFNQSLTEVSQGVYSGSFELDDSDGVFIIDGNALITINIPNIATLMQNKNYTDSEDMLNSINLLTDNSNNFASVNRTGTTNDLNAENATNIVISNGTNGIIDLKQFKELYNKGNLPCDFSRSV